MTTETLTRIVIAAGLDPAHYRIARAATMITESLEADRLGTDPSTTYTVADVWEILGGGTDESIPLTDDAADAAWAIADSLTEEVGYGGIIAA